jgi:hypothetical protein
MRAMIAWQRWGAGLALALSGIAATAAEDAATGLVTQAQGTVQIVAADGKVIPALAFSKLKAGTKVTTGKDGRFQIVYLRNGLQETWGANSQIELGETESKPVNASKLPAIRQLPDSILKGLTRAPDAIANIGSSQGMIRVRSAFDSSKLEAAEKDYKTLRAQAPEDDVTPELYLLAAFSDLKQFDRLKQPLEEMLKRQPANPEIRRIHAAYAKRRAPGATN